MSYFPLLHISKSVYEITHLRLARRSTLAVFQALEAARTIQEARPYLWVVIAAKVLQRKGRNLRHQVGEATVVRLCLRALLSSDRARNTLVTWQVALDRYPACNRALLILSAKFPFTDFVHFSRSSRILHRQKTKSAFSFNSNV